MFFGRRCKIENFIKHFCLCVQQVRKYANISIVCLERQFCQGFSDVWTESSELLTFDYIGWARVTRKIHFNHETIILYISKCTLHVLVISWRLQNVSTRAIPPSIWRALKQPNSSFFTLNNNNNNRLIMFLFSCLVYSYLVQFSIKT